MRSLRNLRTRIRALLHPRSLQYRNLDKIVLALGNPGRQYSSTRHNIGQMALERLLARHSLSMRAGRGDFEAVRWPRGGAEVLLARPGTYMNLSGRAGRQLTDLSALAAPDFLVIVDDLELPLGRMRLRAKGSSGGHRGLASLIEQWGRDDFARLRLGIGRPDPAQSVSDYVLAPFGEEELDTLDKILDAAADAVCEYLDLGLAQAMDRYNALRLT